MPELTTTKVAAEIDSRFDTNKDGQIDGDELLAAARAGLKAPANLGPCGPLFEERTFRLLIIPTLCIIVTIMMAVWNGTEFLFVSDTLNLSTCITHIDAFNGTIVAGIAINADGTVCGPVAESRASFAARWFIWHLASLSIVWYKVRTYPKQLRWLALFNLFALWGCIWSGFQQHRMYWAPGAAEAVSYSHYIFSLIVFVTWFTETITLWEPTRVMGAVYGTIVGVYLLLFVLVDFADAVPDTGVPYIKKHIEIPFEYVVLVIHLVVCWRKAPTFGNSKWRPWLCCGDCCLCCCKGLDEHWNGPASV